jgi:diguanylate cyclase (GGDEF)-like protein
VVIGFIAVVVSHVILKLLLSALEKIRQQAVAIGENEFIINDRIPRTPELKQVVLAMNQMTTTVQTIYDREIDTLKKYQELLYRDQLTGLFNRKYFVNKLNEYIESESENSHGEVAIIAFEGIDNAIAEIGHPNMRPFYDAVAKYMTGNLATAGMLPACFNRQEFAVIMPAAEPQQAEDTVNKLIAWAKELITSDSKINGLITAKAGVASYRYDENTAKVLSKADYALTVAKSLDKGDINHFSDSTNQVVLGKLEWKNMIETALAENRFVLTSQAVKSPAGDLHQEIFVNLKDENGNIQRAGFFMPMVVNLNLANNLDRYVLEKSTEYLTTNSESTLAINITDVFLNDRASFSWFRQLLLNNKHLKERMTFEISDSAINHNADICLDFAGLIKGLGFTFGVDRFMMSPKSLENLQKLKPNYIKIDYDYLIGAEDADTALNALQNITESLGIKLIATKVENKELREALQNKNIKYFQGRGIAEITPLDK